MSKTVTAAEAAALLRPTDSLGLPLGPTQPAALLQALSGRDDWEELRIYGGLVTVLAGVFSHPKVHYLSGFFGPVERMLRDTGANIGFSPADFRRFAPLLAAQCPRVMATAVAPPDAEGWCSLSLHAGATAAEMKRAAADPGRLLMVEATPHLPRTRGFEPVYRHAVHVDDVDIFLESDESPVTIDDAPPTDVDRAIPQHVSSLIPDGATLQTGIGAVPSLVAALLAEGDGGDYGIHSEMFTTGCMRLHQAGKVTNRKGSYDGVSLATFAAGTRDLYDWLDGNDDVAFLPVELINSPEAIARNRHMVTINGAMSIDIQGQVVGRHHLGNAVLRHRRPRGLRVRSGAGAGIPVAPVSALDGRKRRQCPVANRAVVRGGNRRHHPPPPGRHHRHRARRGRAAGKDRPPTR